MRAKNLFRALVGRRSGIVREVVVVPRNVADEPLLFHVGGRVANPQPELGQRDGLAVGGTGETLDEAVIVALCEGVERYCAGSFDQSSLTLTTAAEIPPSKVLPREVVTFSDEQLRTSGFPYQRPSHDMPFRWIEGVDLVSGDALWAPAAAIYMPYRAKDGEQQLCPSTSTGLSCGSSYESAALGALCEVIERDALTLTWLKRATPPQVSALRLRELAELPPHDDLRAYELTSDLGVPVYFVVGRGLDGEGPLLYTGSGCHPCRAVALGKALREALQGRVYVRYLTQVDGGDDEANEAVPSDFSQHAQFYTRNPDLIERAFAFLEGSRPQLQEWSLKDGDGPDDELDWLVDRLSECGIAPRIFDLSHPWCRELDLWVLRAVMPELITLHGHHMLPMLGHPRIDGVERALPLARSFDDGVSPYPHPFA